MQIVFAIKQKATQNKVVKRIGKIKSTRRYEDFLTEDVFFDVTGTKSSKS